jgi:hypothetical protein
MQDINDDLHQPESALGSKNPLVVTNVHTAGFGLLDYSAATGTISALLAGTSARVTPRHLPEVTSMHAVSRSSITTADAASDRKFFAMD